MLKEVGLSIISGTILPFCMEGMKKITKKNEVVIANVDLRSKGASFRSVRALAHTPAF